jgi:sugar transferase (PEP-CTERM/EpsH1 system associated)
VPLYPRIWKLFRQLKPDVVHTCNLAALEVVPIAWLAGVPLRIHAEHGWDAHDPDGSNPRYQRLRRLYRPFVSHYVSVSRDLHDYLGRAIGVPVHRRSLIPNGVDTDHFHPAESEPPTVPGCPFDPAHHLLIGTVGRLQTVKNQPLLARAFVQLLREHPELVERARLVIVGEGPLRAEVDAVLNDAGLSALAWLPGARHDVAGILRMLRVFVLPSQAEGTSCTLQEAMATGLTCVATSVGGTPAVIADDLTGLLVPSNDASIMADTLFKILTNPQGLVAMGQRARNRAIDQFGMATMVARYLTLLSPSDSAATA